MNSKMKVRVVFLALLLGSFLSSCINENQKDKTKANNGNHVLISADESFKPVIDAQIQVYESNRPEAKVVVNYKPEAECLKDLFADSVDIVIVTRFPSAGEMRLLSDSFKTGVTNILLARDAIAVIANPVSEIAYFSEKDIQSLLSGNFKENLIPVFDGVKATSTVRFIIDSVLKGTALAQNVVAARSSEEVIDYISKSKNAIGFIGVTWIGNKDDGKQLEFLKKVKIVPLESIYDSEIFVKPLQANLFNGSYPLVRDLVGILKEKGAQKNQAFNFLDFMTTEKGQLIFKRAYLMPMQKRFSMRPVILNQ